MMRSGFGPVVISSGLSHCWHLWLGCCMQLTCSRTISERPHRDQRLVRHHCRRPRNMSAPSQSSEGAPSRQRGHGCVVVLLVFCACMAFSVPPPLPQRDCAFLELLGALVCVLGPFLLSLYYGQTVDTASCFIIFMQQVAHRASIGPWGGTYRERTGKGEIKRAR